MKKAQDNIARQILDEVSYIDEKARILARSDNITFSKTTESALAGISLNLLITKGELQKRLSNTIITDFRQVFKSNK